MERPARSQFRILSWITSHTRCFARSEECPGLRGMEGRVRPPRSETVRARVTCQRMGLRSPAAILARLGEYPLGRMRGGPSLAPRLEPWFDSGRRSDPPERKNGQAC